MFWSVVETVDCFDGLSLANQKSCYPKQSQQLTKTFSIKFQTSAVPLKSWSIWSCLDFTLTLEKTPPLLSSMYSGLQKSIDGHYSAMK